MLHVTATPDTRKKKPRRSAVNRKNIPTAAEPPRFAHLVAAMQTRDHAARAASVAHHALGAARHAAVHPPKMREGQARDTAERNINRAVTLLKEAAEKLEHAALR